MTGFNKDMVPERDKILVVVEGHNSFTVGSWHGKNVLQDAFDAVTEL